MPILSDKTTTRKEFQKLLYIHLQLKTINGDEYYNLQKQLIEQLKEFIKKDFSVLTANQILHLCAMVSTHRPVAPFVFLIYCDNLVK